MAAVEEGMTNHSTLMTDLIRLPAGINYDSESDSYDSCPDSPTTSLDPEGFHDVVLNIVQACQDPQDYLNRPTKSTRLIRPSYRGSSKHKSSKCVRALPMKHIPIMAKQDGNNDDIYKTLSQLCRRNPSVDYLKYSDISHRYKASNSTFKSDSSSSELQKFQRTLKSIAEEESRGSLIQAFNVVQKVQPLNWKSILRLLAKNPGSSKDLYGQYASATKRKPHSGKVFVPSKPKLPKIKEPSLKINGVSCNNGTNDNNSKEDNVKNLEEKCSSLSIKRQVGICNAMKGENKRSNHGDLIDRYRLHNAPFINASMKKDVNAGAVDLQSGFFPSSLLTNNPSLIKRRTVHTNSKVIVLPAIVSSTSASKRDLRQSSNHGFVGSGSTVPDAPPVSPDAACKIDPDEISEYSSVSSVDLDQ